MHAIMGLRYYLLGITVFKYQQVIERHSVLMIGLMLMLVILFKSFAYRGVLVQIPYLLLLYTAFLCFCNRKNYLYKVGRFTMGIYLLHIPIILKSLSIIVLHLYQGGLVCYTIVLVLGFYMSLYLTKIFIKFRIGRYILGEAL